MLTRGRVVDTLGERTDGIMRRIETKLTERLFLERLEALCAKKTLFDRGYTDKECFVIKRNKNKFWLGKHYIGGFWGPNGYQNCLIFCKYKVNDRGHVDVEYRFGKILLYVFPCVMAFLMCFPIWLVLVYDAIAFPEVRWEGQWGAICVLALLWTVGLLFSLYMSKKEKRMLEAHLHRICKVEPHAKLSSDRAKTK